jgi:hypothetical protein
MVLLVPTIPHKQDQGVHPQGMVLAKHIGELLHHVLLVDSCLLHVQVNEVCCCVRVKLCGKEAHQELEQSAATICRQADQSLNSHRTLGEEAQGERVQGRRGVGKAVTFRGQQVQVIYEYMQCIRGSIEA